MNPEATTAVEDGEELVAKSAVCFYVEPTQEQLRIITLIATLCRDLYNVCLAEVMDFWQWARTNWASWWRQQHPHEPLPDRNRVYREMTWPSFYSQSNAFTQLCVDYPQYRGMNRRVFIAVIRRVHAGIKSFMQLRRNDDWAAKPPGFRSSRFHQTIQWHLDGIRIQGNTLTLTQKVDQGAPLTFTLPSYVASLVANRKIRTVEISRDPGELAMPGRWQVSLVYDIEKSAPVPVNRIVAISVGAKFIGIVDTRGRAWEIPLWRTDKFWQPKITHVERLQERCIRGSGKHRRLALARRRMHNKGSRQRKQYQHELTKWIVSLGDLFVIQEDPIRLGLAKSEASGRVHRGVQNTGMIARLVQMLEYKADRAGKRVVFTSGYQKTVRCCQCGRRHTMMGSHQVIYQPTMNCSCGLIIPRKINHAINQLKNLFDGDEWQDAAWTPLRKQKVLEILFKAQEVKAPRTTFSLA